LSGVRVSSARGSCAGPERDQAGSGEPGASNQLEHAPSVQQTGQVVVEAAIMVLQVLFSVVDAHHDQLFPDGMVWLQAICGQG
jgi:hypothetical protein